MKEFQAYLEKHVGENKDVRIATEALAEMMKTGFSQKKAFEVAVVLNSLPGVSVSPKYEKKLRAYLHQTDAFFETRQLPLFEKTKCEQEPEETGEEGKDEMLKEGVWGVFCKDPPAFIDFVLDKRNLKDKKVILKVGLDSGQGFLKVV